MLAALQSISTVVKVSMSVTINLSLASAAVALDCGEWTPIGSGSNGVIRAATTFNGQLVVGGHFTSIGGTKANLTARWDGMSWQPLGGGPYPAVGQQVRNLIAFEGDLIAAGEGFIRRWDGSQWYAMEDGWVQHVALSVTVHDGSLYVGSKDGRVYRWDGGAWTQIGQFHSWTGSHQVNALHSWNGDLIAAGGFLEPYTRVARWDGEQWHPLGDGLPNVVNALTTHKGSLIAGTGDFNGGAVMQWNGANWSPVGFDSPSSRALVVYAGDLHSGNGAAATWFDGYEWQPTGVSGTIAFAVLDNNLVSARQNAFVNVQVEARLSCTGACCAGGGCLSLTLADCAAIGGHFHGMATSCGDAECDGPEPDTCPADLTNSGNVGVPDLLQLLSQWGPCP